MADKKRKILNRTLGVVQQRLGVSAICDTQVTTQQGRGFRAVCCRWGVSALQTHGEQGGNMLVSRSKL
jgi:hypothetical protein